MTVQERMQKLVDDNAVLLLMKGTADYPQCGFSMRAVSILRALNVPFQTVNILEDAELRQGAKEFANWPTFPQLYVKKEFVGGSDIMMEMWESGELEKLVDGIS